MQAPAVLWCPATREPDTAGINPAARRNQRLRRDFQFALQSFNHGSRTLFVLAVISVDRAGRFQSALQEAVANEDVGLFSKRLRFESARQPPLNSQPGP